MKRSVRNPVNRLFAVALAAMPLLVGAASGEFTFVTGDVSLQKASGQRSVPVRGTPVDAGDRITTGASGMAQLTMVDQARLSLRPSTQFQIEAYPEKRDSNEGAVLSLLRGTLRTFTGLLASANRDKFVMKTRVATVGIRGSGNILYACDPGECDESVTNGKANTESITVNHTIEGSHSVTNNSNGQGASETLITGPGQTVLVAGFNPPRFIPTPKFISNAATTMGTAKPADSAATTSAAASGESRNFSPSDAPAVPGSQQGTTQVVTGNPIGFVSPVDARVNLATDPVNLRDIIINAGSPFSGQATASGLQLNGNDLTGYTAYAGSQSGVNPAIVGGTLSDTHFVSNDGVTIFMGRYDGASLSLSGPTGSATPVAGSTQWIYAISGYPTYLSEVLTGTAAYTLAAATAPTNQVSTPGALGSASLSVNFTARTLNFAASVSIPAAGGNGGGSWNLNATNVPVSFNAFAATTNDRLVITSGGISSATNAALTGGFQGSLVGNGLTGAILGYSIQDTTAVNAAAWNYVNGVAAFTGTRQDGTTPYREGRISDPAGTLTDFIRSYATTDRPDEVTFDAQNRVISFSAPFSGTGGAHSTYSLGTSTVVESGFDPDTGLTWGRWAGGQAVVTNGTQSVGIDLTHTSLHYIFAGAQSGPTTLPLTGTATYTVIGSTSPTNGSGAVGTFGSASLNANFTNRTVDAAVNIAIAGQTWTGAASNMPIYREQYFSAYSGNPIPGVPNPTPLIIGCTPNCGAGATGSFDGFFTGSTGQRAGMMYNLGGNQGAVAFGRGSGG